MSGCKDLRSHWLSRRILQGTLQLKVTVGADMCVHTEQIPSYTVGRCCNVGWPRRSLLALARGHALVVAPLLCDQHVPAEQGQLHKHSQQQQHIPQQQAPRTCQVHYCEQQVTAVAWFAHLRSFNGVPAQLARSPQQHGHKTGAANTQQQQQDLQAQRRNLPRASSESLLETDVLLSGTVNGHLQIHTASGQLLVRQRLASSAVLDIIVRPYCSGQLLWSC